MAIPFRLQKIIIQLVKNIRQKNLLNNSYCINSFVHDNLTINQINCISNCLILYDSVFVYIKFDNIYEINVKYL